MSKIYVVTSGEYSDYHIDAVFDNFEQAALYCAAHSGHPDIDDDPLVEEYELNEVKLEGKVYYGAYFYVRKYGDVSPIVIELYHRFYLHPIKEKISMSDAKKTYSNEFYQDIKGVVPVNGHYDIEKLKKIVLDRINKYLAEQEGI